MLRVMILALYTLIETVGKDITDLRRGKTLPTAGLRGQRQHGGILFGATSQSKDLSVYVKKKIFVRSAVFDRNAAILKSLNQEYLFPTAHQDSFYSALIEARTSSRREFHKLLGWIVEYVQASAI
jgi:hypothetical protein